MPLGREQENSGPEYRSSHQADGRISNEGFCSRGWFGFKQIDASSPLRLLHIFFSELSARNSCQIFFGLCLAEKCLISVQSLYGAVSEGMDSG